MLSINTNTSQMTAARVVNLHTAQAQRIGNAISTGQTVASPKDSGASYAIAQNIRGQIASYEALSHARDRTLGVLDTTTAGLQSIGDLLIQMKRLAANASDASLDTTARAALNNDYQALKDQIDNVAAAATFSDINLLNDDGYSTMYWGPGANSGAGAMVRWNGGTSGEPKAGDTLQVACGLQSVGPQYQDIKGLLNIGFRYCGSDSNWVTTTLAPFGYDTLYPANSQQTTDYTTTLPNIPVGATAAQIYVEFNGSINNAHISEAIGSDGGAGSAQILASWVPGSNTVTFGTSKHGITTFADNLFLNGIDGSQARLHSAFTTSFGLGLDASNIGTASDASDAIGSIQFAMQRVQSQMNYYADWTKSFESRNASENAIADTLRSAVGHLTDADLGAEAAALKANQTKQQLAVQALSLANAAPNIILSLFQ